jgi:hypothetical protein
MTFLRSLLAVALVSALAAAPAEAAYIPTTAGTRLFLKTPTSANLAGALTNETGSGAAVFATSPTLDGTPTISAANGSGGLTLTNTSRSRSWAIKPVNSNANGTANDLSITADLDSLGSLQVARFMGDDGRLVIGHNTAQGVLNGRVNTGIQVTGRATGENTNFLGEAFDGTPYVTLRRFDTNTGNGLGSIVAVGPYEVTGVYCTAAYGGGGDDCGAGLLGLTTETAVHSTWEGQGLFLFSTVNHTNYLIPSLSISAGGLGGVSIGWNLMGSYPTGIPADLGNGSVHAMTDVAVDGRLRGMGTAPTLGGDCGGASIVGNDVAGFVGPIGTSTACTVTYHTATAVGAEPVCVLMNYANATPTIMINGTNETHFRAEWTSAYSGYFQYICMGRG